MATTSEIQVTEAYIGLLGRAPDPAGLAYWAAQLDAAIAAGEDAAVALKKLTKDITLNAEWTTGLGANDVSTQAGADALVQGMYTNLFGRDATAADKTYWSAELMNGTTTASEMAVQLIQGAQANANTTDADVLGYKQEAATYYVENVAQADFTKTNAGTAVSGVNGPITLQSSKDATDALVTGTGSTINLTTATDTITMTMGDDTVNGTVGTGATYGGEAISDPNAGDEDVLNLSGDATAITLGTVSNVETVNFSLEKQFGSTFTITSTGVVGGTMNVTTAPTTTVAGVTVTGSQLLNTVNLGSNLTTTNVLGTGAGVIDMNDSNASQVSISTDAALTTLSIDDINDKGVAVTMANDASVSLTLKGDDGANDAASVSANNAVALNLSGGANSVDDLTLSGNTNDVTYTVTNAVAADLDVTLTGAKDITLKGTQAMFTGSKLADSSTGTATLDVTTMGGDLDLTNWAVIDMVDLSADAAGRTVTVNSGQNVKVSANQGGTLVLDDADSGNDASVTITLDGGTDNALTAGVINTKDFGSVTVNADNQTVTGLSMDTKTAGNDAALTIAGTNDVSGAALDTGVKNLTVNVGDLSLTGNVAGNDISLTTSNDDLTVTGTTTAANGGSIVVSATDTATLTGNVAADNSGAGETVDITGDTIVLGGTVAGYTVDLTANNDTTGVSTTANTITAATDVTIDGGKWTITGDITATAGTIYVSGDAAVNANGDTLTAPSGIYVTSTGARGATDLGTVVSPVVNAQAAGNDVDLILNGNAGPVTVLTNTGADQVTLNDNVAFTVNTGEGNDVVVISDAGATSVINTGGGADTASGTETAALTLSMGAGDDTYTPAAASGVSADMGEGTADKVVLGGVNISAGTGQITNYEIMDISGGAGQIDSNQFANDNTFQVTGANTLTITVDTTATTVDASNLTFDIGAVANLAIAGSAANDTITGSAVVDVITSGGAGANGGDTMSGGGGADTITGDSGHDTINGGEAADILGGAAGNDTINGDAGVDKITGGDGKDTLTGGAGADQYIYTEIGDGAATVTITSIATDANNFVVSTSEADAVTYVQADDNILIDGNLEAALEAAGATADSSAALDFNAAGIFVIRAGEAKLDDNDFGDISDIATAVNSLTVNNAAANDEVLFTIENAAGTNTALYYWKDVNGNGDIDVGDKIALLAVFSDDDFVVADIDVTP